MSILISRTIGENILLSKYDIRALPFYEDEKSETLDINHDDGLRQLRTLHKYPIGFDFSCNLIQTLKDNNIFPDEDYIDGTPYYFAWIAGRFFNEYLASISDYTKRQTAGRQLLTDLTTGFVCVRTGTNAKGRYLLNIPPFRIVKIVELENGEKLYRYAWAKDIFETLVTGDCTKQGNDGYILLPPKLYPIATQATKAAESINNISKNATWTDSETGEKHEQKRTHLIGSSNPIYKMEVFAKMKNTNNASAITVKRKELLQTVAPELVDKDGYLKNIKAYQLHDILQNEIRSVWENFKDENMLVNFYLGKSPDSDSSLYFLSKHY